jgi:lysophospholipase L1-like esterase
VIPYEGGSSAGRFALLHQQNSKPMTHRFTKRLFAITAAIATAMPALAQNNAPVDVAAFNQPVKLACVGDSITKGFGTKRSWPDQIGEMLGNRWVVQNFGVNGATLMNSGDKPYQTLGAFTSAVGFAPDVVVIMLGTNDTKPHNWKNFASDYEKDYRDLIGKFARLESKPRIFICNPPYIAKDGNWGINEADTKTQIPVIEKLARSLNAGIIDVHAALEGHDELIPDKVHPNTEGATLIAEAVFKALTGKTAPVPAVK